MRPPIPSPLFMTLMSHAPLRPAGVSPLFVERNCAIERLRDCLVSLGDCLRIFETTDHDAFLDDEVEPNASRSELRDQATVEQLLGTIHNTWDPESHPDQSETVSPQTHSQLRDCLLNFGDTFRLYHFERARVEVSREQCEQLSTHELIALFDEVWHEQAGCYGHLPDEHDEMYIEKQLKTNLKLIDNFASRITFTEAAVDRWRSIREMRWYIEARYLSDHSIDTWIPKAAQLTPIRRAMTQIRKVARLQPKPTDQERALAGDFEDAASDAIAALLTFRISSELVSQALYEPFEPSLPIIEMLLATQGR